MRAALAPCDVALLLLGALLERRSVQHPHRLSQTPARAAAARPSHFLPVKVSYMCSNKAMAAPWRPWMQPCGSGRQGVELWRTAR
jgi:hypothetical protein